MDKTVPRPAARLLDFIGLTEAPQGYGTVFGNKQHMLAKPLTSMTFDEVVANGPWRSRTFGSSAAGRYQFMRDTLDKPNVGGDIKAEMKLSGKELFDSNLQDRMGFHLLKRRGYGEFMSGKIGHTEFGKRLAQEWASFPVLSPCQGAHRKLKRGQSYYAGDGLNKALVKPEKVEAVLDEVLKLSKVPAAPPPVPVQPVPSVPVSEAALEEERLPVGKPEAKRGFLEWLIGLWK